MLPTSRLPLDVKETLTKFISSVNQLEVLFLLFEQSSKKWNSESVCRELRSNVTSAKIQLTYLASAGLIECENEQFFFNPHSDKAEAVKRLHDEYQEKSVAIIAFIYEKPHQKLREFADAFKLKKD